MIKSGQPLPSDRCILIILKAIQTKPEDWGYPDAYYVVAHTTGSAIGTIWNVGGEEIVLLKDRFNESR